MDKAEFDDWLSEIAALTPPQRRQAWQTLALSEASDGDDIETGPPRGMDVASSGPGATPDQPPRQNWGLGDSGEHRLQQTGGQVAHHRDRDPVAEKPKRVLAAARQFVAVRQPHEPGRLARRQSPGSDARPIGDKQALLR